MSAELREDLNHLDMPFITRHVQRRPAIRITLIQQRLGKLGILLNQQLIAGLEITLLRENPDVPQETPLLFLILFSLRLDALSSLLCLS